MVKPFDWPRDNPTLIPLRAIGFVEPKRMGKVSIAGPVSAQQRYTLAE
jgi:hypothetical protein